jgi:hypothetical protein
MMSSETLRSVVAYKLTDVSEMLTVSIIRAALIFLSDLQQTSTSPRVSKTMAVFCALILHT